MSILLGLGALIFAFFLLLCDPQQGGQVIEQIKKTTSSIVNNKPAETPTALAPEGRLDGMATPDSGPGFTTDDSTSLSSAEEYLNSAWKSPGAGQQQPAMKRQFPQQGFAGLGQRGFPQPGQGQQQQGFGQGFKQFNGPQSFSQNQNQDSGRAGAARGDVQNELSVAKSQAAQAASCMDRAINSQDPSEKSSAANQARYHAGLARAAATRATSRAGGIPEVQALVGQVRNAANQANYSAQQASSAASGW